MAASIIKVLKSRRDFLALTVAVPLSGIFAAIVFSSGLAIGSTFLVFSFLLSFIVCYISDRNTIITSLVANLIFIIGCLIQKYIVLHQPFFGWTSETAAIFPLLAGVSLFLALMISIIFTLVRKELREN